MPDNDVVKENTKLASVVREAADEFFTDGCFYLYICGIKPGFMHASKIAAEEEAAWINTAITRLLMAERERCAKIAETVPWEIPGPNPVQTKIVGGRIAAAIRSRHA